MLLFMSLRKSRGALVVSLESLSCIGFVDYYDFVFDDGFFYSLWVCLEVILRPSILAIRPILGRRPIVVLLSYFLGRWQDDICEGL